MTRATKALILALAGLVAVGTMAAALGPIVFRGVLAPLADSRSVRPTMVAEAGSGVQDQAPDTGDWTVVQESWAGYRLTGPLARGGLEIVGRTDEVSGGITIDHGTITSAVFTVDVSRMTTGDRTLDRLFRSVALSSPESATAELIVQHGTARAVFGEVTSVHMSGELFLNGVTHPVDFSLQTQLAPDGGVVVGQVPVSLHDYLDADDLPAGTGNASLEFSLTLQRG